MIPQRIALSTIDTSELSDSIAEVTKKLCENFIKAEEEIIIDVLSAHLNRVPTIEDIKRCSKIYYQMWEPMNYQLQYDNKPLGNMIFNILLPSPSIEFKLI